MRLEAVPLALEFCHARLASRDEFASIARRIRHACAAFGAEARVEDGGLVASWS